MYRLTLIIYIVFYKTKNGTHCTRTKFIKRVYVTIVILLVWVIPTACIFK